jgi:glycosyltransferase involved in cell wall biosynthesis
MRIGISRADRAGQPLIAFGVNSAFALNHLLGHTLIGLAGKGYHMAAIAPHAEDEFLHVAACPDLLLKNIAMKREIAPLTDLLVLWKLIVMLRRLKPAILNLSTPKMALLGGMAAFIVRVPRRIYFLRGLRYETATGWKRRLLMACERVACACAHQVVCVSASVREGAIHDRIVPASKTAMLGERGSDGIDLARFEAPVDGSGGNSQCLRRKLGIPEGCFVVGYVGRLTRDKGVHELVGAITRLRAEGRDAHLLVVGAFEAGDPVDPACEAQIRTDPAIHFTGYMQDPVPYYRIMDLFAFPSYREGLGNVLLEAAAAGKPSVATRVTGVVDAVDDGVTGVLVPVRDPLALSNAMADLMDNPGKRQSMSRAGRIFVKKNFDADVMVDALANFLSA